MDEQPALPAMAVPHTIRAYQTYFLGIPQLFTLGAASDWSVPLSPLDSTDLAIRMTSPGWLYCKRRAIVILYDFS